METWFPVLRQRGREVTAQVAESCDVVFAAGVLGDFYASIWSHPASGPVSIEPFRRAGLDDKTVARLLRGVLFQTIEILREELDHSVLGDAVLTVRGRLDPVIPRPAVDSAEREFYRRLMENEIIQDEPQYVRLQSLLHDVAGSINDVIYAHDLNGMFLFMNRHGFETTHFTIDDILSGLSIFDLIAPEFQETIESRLEMPGAVSRAPYTTEIYTKDGMRIALELSTRVLRRNKQDLAVIGLARDLRLARRLESEVRRMHACMDALMTGPLAVFVLDLSGTVQDANRAAVQLFGAPGAGALVGVPFTSLLAEGPADMGRQIETAAGGKRIEQCFWGKTIFGGSLTCELSILPVTDGQTESEHLLILLNDVSIETTLRQNLIQREKLASLGTVMAGVAHELSNPLTAVMGFAQTLLADNPKDPDRHRLEQIVKEAMRCRQIMQNLINFAQPRVSGKSFCNVNEILEQILSLRQYQMSLSGIRLHRDFASNLPPLYCDGHELQRVFLHLVINAHQALLSIADRERVIEVTTSTDANGNITVRFADNGPGMTDAVQARVFDPFFTTKGHESVGLGLSMSRQIIRDHGGDIQLRAIEEEGTEVTVVLPVKGSEKTAVSPKDLNTGG